MVATQSSAEGGAGTGTTTTSTSVLSVYPHLGHYVFSLLSTNFNSPPKAAASHHPLSVSSSGESDDEDEGKDKESKDKPGQNGDSKQGKANGEGVDKEALVRRIVEMLDNEEEDEVKDLLKPYMGDLGKDEILMDQVCLDCMHRRRDDVEGIAFGVPHYLTPTRTRSAASITAAPHRPFTPTRLPSFRARTPLGRPQSPSLPASGTLTPTSIYPTSGLARSDTTLSPSSSTHALPSASGPSSSGSPVSSPRMLSAKAVAFNPSPRAVSAPLSAVPPSFSPSDPWKDVPADPPRSASPFGAVGAPSMTRTSSNLAIAAPLFSDQLSPFHSPIGTPNKVHSKVPDPFSSPSLMKPSSRGIVPEDDDDDEFSPFGSAVPKLRPQGSSALNTSAKAFEPDSYFGSAGIPHSDSGQSYDSYGSGGTTGAADAPPEDDAGTGMTPLDVLSSVFSTIPKVELEDALHRSGYDFESAMAMLVSSHTLPRSGASTPQRVSSPRPLLGVGGRGAMPLSHAGPKEGYFTQGGRTYGGGSMSPGLMGGTRSPGGPATRMCRYFLAGECRRSDCRFSHDLDRALCRFWLRGHCAKGPNCEFLHQFPNGFDPSALSNAMSRVELGHDGSANHSPAYPPHHSSGGGDEFPDLLAAKLGRAGRFDPSRNRFANAVKRPVPGPITMPSIQIAGSRYGVTPQSRAYSPAHTPTMESRTTVLAVPRPSQRIKLRPPTLLPTVKTGAVANEQYMNSRATAIRLGHARNACLARAADAFRRGDGAAAKRFSREGKSLNERMLNETSEAAQTLVQDRREDVQRACRERDINWSDDPSDRTMRGKECGGGLGVIMGVASKRSVVGGDYLSMDERLESLIDLHTLHGNEAGEMLGHFLAELEKENYRGLAYVLVGEEKHVGTQDPGRGASKIRLAASVKQCLAEWGYAWNETAGVICVDPCRF